MTPNAFRRIALAFDGAVEKAHMGHPDFRAGNGKIFATLHEDQKHGMVKLTPQQQRRFMGDSPGAFAPAAGAWGLGGATIVTLAAFDAEILGEAMTLAWQNVQIPSTRTSTKARRPLRRSPRPR
jgi:hypothetical protein